MDASDTSALLEELRSRTDNLFVLLRCARVLGESAAAAIEKTATEVERRLARDERAVLVLGEEADRRALFDSILGERVLASAQRESRTTVRLRSRPVIDYEATLRGEVVERFQQSLPRREEAFAKAITRAERDLAAAHEAEATAAALEAEQRAATTLVVKMKNRRNWLLVAWGWLLAWIRGSLSLTRGAATLPGGSARDEPARDTPARVAKATAHRATLEAERRLYGAQRRDSFFAALRALTDDLSRGGEVLELTIDFPSLDLPPGITLVSAPDIVSYEGIDGCLLVTDGAAGTRERFAAPLEALGATVSRSIAPTAPTRDLRRVLAEESGALPPSLQGKRRSLSRARASRARSTMRRAQKRFATRGSRHSRRNAWPIRPNSAPTRWREWKKRSTTARVRYFVPRSSTFLPGSSRSKQRGETLSSPAPIGKQSKPAFSPSATLPR